MSNPEHVKIVRQGTEALTQWQSENPDVLLDLSGANLGGAELGEANLHEANLSEANLFHTNLKKANLSKADLSKANLFHADLSESNLRYANLNEANLHDANLSQANLLSADLSKASMFNADFNDANCINVNLKQANLKMAIFKMAILRDANLSQANMSKADLSWCDLSGADLSKADLNTADLSNADLSWCKMSGSKLNETDLTGAILNAADLSLALLQGTNLESTELTNVIVDSRTYFSGCKYNKKSDATGTALRTARFNPITDLSYLEWNMRRHMWETKYQEMPTMKKWAVQAFWWSSDYGNSTQRILACIVGFALLFAMIYSSSIVLDDYIITSELPFVELPDKLVSASIFMRIYSCLYFSCVTMTTLGFGDIHANPLSVTGQALVMLEVLIGYILLGSLITRLSVSFTSVE
ncbi:pentapeptide repeat-containing protein [Gimesia aquarii]|uniref:Secreted effector protein pipB2 n=1 Tax=Gimesia aquarii TaxID=2527964 RepID=A0A517VW53_9PLAN|nr:pentapeptide repeat-containing protein [Gimesia aquarii]QDT97227.1 Secreted effector protein pipB2 [Gimesia aquarii]